MSLPSDETVRVVQAISRWWKIKIAQDNQDTAMYRQMLGDRYDQFMRQIGADIDHSYLLRRLIAGEEPEER